MCILTLRSGDCDFFVGAPPSRRVLHSLPRPAAGNPSSIWHWHLRGTPVPQSLRRLEHEYSLAAERDPMWAARPLALTRHEGRTVLLLNAQEQPLEVTRFLRIAIGSAVSLWQVHRHGLIRKDVRPPNMLVDDPQRMAHQLWDCVPTVVGTPGNWKPSSSRSFGTRSRY